uniref:hypothetical protein n=1 Tax=Parabacteroides distasonis TaxID=823 RepID=UPI00402554DB
MFTKELNVNVVEAAERRILEAFNTNKIVGVSFSGGKDSICMCDMLVKTMRKYAFLLAVLSWFSSMRKLSIRTLSR